MDAVRMMHATGDNETERKYLPTLGRIEAMFSPVAVLSRPFDETGGLARRGRLFF